MKKFNRTKHKTMGTIPPQIRAMISGVDMSVATAQFNSFMTNLAIDFHRQLASGTAISQIKLTAPDKLFGFDVKLDYLASGSIGSVYKMQIGDLVFVFKINRDSGFGELNAMSQQSRARNLVNKAYIGSVFEFSGRKYSWVISDYIANDYTNSIANAMQRLFYAYLTKGININDIHVNNFKDGKLIDIASLYRRTGKIDDISNLNKPQRDIVQQLAYYIKTNNSAAFEQELSDAAVKYPELINYMFYAMNYARTPIMCSVLKDSEFAKRVNNFQKIVNQIFRINKHKIIQDLNTGR